MALPCGRCGLLELATSALEVIAKLKTLNIKSKTYTTPLCGWFARGCVKLAYYLIWFLGPWPALAARKALCDHVNLNML